MPDQQNEHKSTDEILAGFADQIIDNLSPAEILFSENPEIKALQETMQYLKKEIPTESPVGSAKKIRGQVNKIWEAEYRPQPSLVDKIKQNLNSAPQKKYKSATRRRQITVVRITAAAILVIIAAFILLPSVNLDGGSTSGAAGGELGPWAIIGGLILVGAVALWWWLDSRRK